MPFNYSFETRESIWNEEIYRRKGYEITSVRTEKNLEQSLFRSKCI